MQRMLCLLLITNNMNAASSQQMPPWIGQQNIPGIYNYNVYTPGDINNSSTLQASNHTQQEQNQIQKIDQNIHVSMNVTHEFKITWPEITTPDFFQYATSPCNMLYDHRWKLCVATFVASYSLILYRAKQAESLLQEHDAWCNWKAAVPMAHLMTSNGQDLLQQLKIDFYKKYALTSAAISTCKFADLFINDIKYELKLLENYAFWQTITKRIWCNKLFFFQYDANIIAEKKARILFILDLFMAHYAKEYI